MPTFVFVICLALVVIVCAMYLRFALKVAKLSGIAMEAGENSNIQAGESFLFLVEAAKNSLETFDDGDKEAGSIYESHEVVEAIKRKLDHNPEFKLTCYFNARAEDLLFCKELKAQEQIEIHDGLEPVPKERPSNELHYKLVDDGKLAYVSWHAYSDQNREYWQGDCRHLSDKQVKARAKSLYSEMREHAHAKLSAQQVQQ